MSSNDASTLYGNAPDKCTVALLLIDTINDLEFDGGKQLLQHALPMAKKILKLKRRCQEQHIPVIYVNDNFGRWRSDFKAMLSHCIKDEVRGKEIVQTLKPDEKDYFVLKLKHSGFYASTLSTLLRYLGARTLILTGMATDICVLFTANDAYMRDYDVVVPRDCVASLSKKINRNALELMERVLKAKTTLSTKIDLPRLKRETRK
jgi:nicotinamidase-related amidase